MNSKQSFEGIIRLLYSKYAPSKSDEVSNLLKKYEGQEDELFQSICKKYGISDEEVKTLKAESHFEDSGIRKKNSRRITLILVCLIGGLLLFFIGRIISKNGKPVEVSEAAIVYEENEGNTPIVPNQKIEKNEESNVVEIELSKKTYTVKEKAFFHDLPTEDSKRQAYLVEGEVFSSKIEENGFLFVEFVNPKGQKTKGWIQKDSSITQTDSKKLSGKTD